MRYRHFTIATSILAVSCIQAQEIRDVESTTAVELALHLREVWEPILSSCPHEKLSPVELDLLEAIADPMPMSPEPALVEARYESSSSDVKACVLEYVDWYVARTRDYCSSDCTFSKIALTCGPSSTWIRDSLIDGALEFCSANRAV